MFTILLKFTEKKSLAGEFMEQHKIWIQEWIQKDIFLVAGSLFDNTGGAIIAHNIEKEDLEKIILSDPFVEKKIVSYEIIGINPSFLHPIFAKK